MKEALTFCEDFVQDPWLDETGKEHPWLTSIYTEHELYDSVMSKRKPVSEEMHNFIIHQRTLNNNHENNAMADWLTIGRQAGLRLSEYGQDQVLLDKNKHYALNAFGDSKAFLLADFTFYRPGGIPLLTASTEPLNLTQITAATIRWRLQKNGEKDEIIWYAKNETNPTKCVVQAMLNIRTRAIALGIPSHHPIGVFQHNHNTYYLTNTIIRKHLQTAAITIHKITDKKILQLYSSHSIRVMACVLLHAMGKSTSFIKHRLRWKSDAFQEYLRHVPISAKHHNEALTDCSFFL